MENQTGFNLNEAIAQWRGELTSQPGVSAEKVRELESHLQDSLADLQQRGLTLEESFLLARRRLGSTKAIADEIVKEDPSRVWTDRAYWTTVGLIVLYFFFRVTWIPFQVLAAKFVGYEALPAVSLFYTVPTYFLGGWAVLAAARGRFPKFLQRVGSFLVSPRGIAIGLAVYLSLSIGALSLSFWSTVGQRPHMSVVWNTIHNICWPIVLGVVLLRLTQIRSRHRTMDNVTR